MPRKKRSEADVITRQPGRRLARGEPITRHIESGDEYATRNFRHGPAGPGELFDPDLPPGDTLSVIPVGPWWVLVEVADVEGRLEAIRLEIRGYANENDREAAPITATALRDIAPGALIDIARNEYRGDAEGYVERLRRRQLDEDGVAVLAAAERHAAAAGSPKRRPGRPRIEETPDFHVAVAAYRDAVRAGSRTPDIDAAKAIQARDQEATTMARWMRRARALGLLPPTSRGVSKA